MTQTSGFYTTSATPVGHQLSSYNMQTAAKAFGVIAATHGKNGAAADYLNELVGSVPGANTARIASGGAIVDGGWYESDAAEDVTIPSAVGGGNTRIDRIVLRMTWANFECVITRIAGTDAIVPVAPAITQTPGTVYDIMLYQALVDTGGTVTLTDERVFATIDLGEIGNNAVTDANLRDSQGLSVIGKATSGTGDPADIIAGLDNLVLRRSGASVGFGQIVAAGITSGTITAAQIANRTRTFFVYSETGIDGSGPSLILPNITGVPCPDGVATYIANGFLVPSDFVSGLSVAVIGFAAKSGNIYSEFNAIYQAIGEAYNTHSAASALATHAMTINVITSITSLSLASASAGDIVLLDFTRSAGSVQDTINDGVYICGFLVTYTADS